MLLLGVVSLVAFGFIGVMNYQELRADLDAALRRAVSFAPVPNEIPQVGMAGEEGGFRDAPLRSVPVFSVTVYGSDTAHIIVNESSTAQMDDSVYEEVVNLVLASDENEGVLPEYGLYYRTSHMVVGTRIAFADVSAFAAEIRNNVLMLLGLWIALMLVLFGITFFLSRYVTRPVERAWEEQQRFIADASHELKTPLTIIMADASILAQNPQATVGEQSVWVEGISAEAERMQQLTEDMLTLAQADASSGASSVFSEVDFSSLVQGQVLQFDAVAFERGLTIDAELEEGLRVLGDERKLENFVKTLLENACKYAEVSSAIEVSLQHKKGNAVLAVRNTGAPIPAEDLPHVFDRFYRSDKARTREGETASFGLGLSIAQSTVHMHGGAIEVSSDEQATIFTAQLPLAK